MNIIIVYFFNAHLKILKKKTEYFFIGLKKSRKGLKKKIHQLLPQVKYHIEIFVLRFLLFLRYNFRRAFKRDNSTTGNSL